MGTKTKGYESGEYEPGRGYSKEDWDAVSDNPEITEEQLAQAKPFRAVFPDLYESIQRTRGRPKSEDPKEAVTLRLPRSVLQRWKTDPDWRAKMEKVLERSV